MKGKKKPQGHKPVNIRLPIDLYSKAQELAAQKERSLSKTLTIIIREHFEATA